MRAIPTYYKDILFRSKLETRYARTLDSLGIKWEYELEGVELDSGSWYLPDFYLPDITTFLEVKGVFDDSIKKPEELRLCLSGEDDWFDPKILVLVGCANGILRIPEGDWDEDIWSIKCRECGGYSFMSVSRSYRCRVCGAHDGDHHLEESDYFNLIN